MKTIKVFETIDELIEGFNNVRAEGDEFPYIPPSVELRYADDGKLYFVGEEPTRYFFDLGDLYYRDLANRVLEMKGIRIKRATDEQK